MMAEFDPYAFHTDPNANWARIDLRTKAQHLPRHEAPLYRYMNDILKGYFDTRARFSIAPQALLRHGYSTLPEDDPLGLRSMQPTGTEYDVDDEPDPDDSITTTDSLGASIPVYEEGDGPEQDKLQPDFIGSRRLDQIEILVKIFGMWELKRNEKFDTTRATQFDRYLQRLQQKGVSPGFRAFLVNGRKTHIYDINGNRLRWVETGFEDFFDELQSLLRTALTI